MDRDFKKTKAGLKICPFFGWTSELVEGPDSQVENDVNLVICNHEQNEHKHEGNCHRVWCPLLKTEEPKCSSCRDTGKPWCSCDEYHPASSMCPPHEVRMQNGKNLCPVCGVKA